MESLKISNLDFSYGENQLFKKYNIDIELKKNYAIIGPSGVGKSTLALLMAGHLTPEKGEVTLNGVLINKPRRDVLIIHQEDDLFPWLTIKEQLQFVGGNESQITELLKLFKLDKYPDHYPYQLSGGMKKRLALIRAECAGASVLILDETMGAMDEVLIHDILEKMIPRWKKLDKTIIFITHHLDDVKPYVDEVIKL